MIVNPWLMYKAGEYLGEMTARMAESDFKEEQRIEAIRRKEKEQKECEKAFDRMREEEADRLYRMENPHCTEMFNHFDMGDYWFPVKYLW